MQEKTVDKIKNLVGRTFVSLPAATDLPRLLKHLRVYVVEGTKGTENNNESNLEASQIYPSAASNEESIVNNLYHLTVELTRVLSGENDVQAIRDTFFTAFKKENKEPPSPAIPRAEPNNDGIDNLPDPKLKEALRYLPTAFTGSTSSGSFLFKLDKPSANILLSISSKGVRVEFKNAIDPKAQDEVDCTLTCSGPVLTAIVCGMLPAITVLQNGQLKVDNMAKLMDFSKSFKFDKETFEKYKVQQKNLLALAKDHSEDTVAVSNNMKKYYTEILGDDNRVVKVLKAINSATVSPAIIELKFALGVNYMTKDVPNTWKWDIYFYPNDKIVLKSRKSEQDLKNLFKYTWELSITLDWKSSFVSTSLSIIHLLFLEGASGQNSNLRENIVKVLSVYAPKQVIDSALNNSTSVESGPHLVNSNNKIQVEKYPNGDQYEGEFNDKGLRHGKGVYTTPSGDVYVGTYVDGQREGYGTYTMSDGTRYEGEFKNGFPNGKGIYVFSNGDVYTGEFRDDEFHGEGTWSSTDGSNYQGEFSSGKRHGKGVFFSRGSTYEGEWNVGTFHGFGIYLYINNDLYEGEFRNGKFNGYGRYTVSATGQVIEGEFKDGKPVGVAVETKKLDKPEESKAKFEKWREENAKTIEARKKLLITLSRRSLS